MEFSSLTSIKKDNKVFLNIKLSEHREIFKGSLILEGIEYIVPEDIIDTICRISGVSNSMNKILRMKSESTWIDTVILMYQYYYPEGFIYLLADDTQSILGASSKSMKPILNSEFFTESDRFLSDYEDIVELSSYTYDRNNTISSFLLFQKVSHVLDSGSYRVGILFTNNELDKVTCTLAIDYEGIVFYLPKKIYNLSSSRYNKTSQDSIEAYKLLMIRIIEDMSREGEWDNILGSLHNHIMGCKSLPITYEEYRRATRLISRVSALSDIDADEVDDMLQYLEEEFSDFEQNYPSIEDKKSSYIWRCSAVSDFSVYRLVCALQTLCDTHVFYPESMPDIRHTIGDFIVLDKLSTELARKVGGVRES